MKAFLHELQLMGTNRFCEYDYGSTENMVVYGREHPPDYNLTNVRAPISLIVGPNDIMAHKEVSIAVQIANVYDYLIIIYQILLVVYEKLNFLNWFSHAKMEDAKTLASKLPKLVDFHFVPYDHFTHLDFCYATDVGSLVYKHVVGLLNAYDEKKTVWRNWLTKNDVFICYST